MVAFRSLRVVNVSILLFGLLFVFVVSLQQYPPSLELTINLKPSYSTLLQNKSSKNMGDFFQEYLINYKYNFTGLIQ